jgi:acyl-CoA thioester hydrolase
MDTATPVEVRVRIEVRWRDLDMLGHLNQAVYHEFLEEGRAALFEHLGRIGDFAFVLARVELDYRHEVRRDHEAVEIVVRPVRVGRSSVVVEHDIVLPDGTVAAAGSSVLVAWDTEGRCSRPFAHDERAKLLAASGGGAQDGIS